MDVDALVSSPRGTLVSPGEAVGVSTKEDAGWAMPKTFMPEKDPPSLPLTTELSHPIEAGIPIKPEKGSTGSSSVISIKSSWGLTACCAPGDGILCRGGVRGGIAEGTSHDPWMLEPLSNSFPLMLP